MYNLAAFQIWWNSSSSYLRKWRVCCLKLHFSFENVILLKNMTLQYFYIMLQCVQLSHTIGGSRQIGPRTVGPRTTGPRTTGPRGPTVRGPICHFWGADSWAPDNRAPGPNCPGPNCPGPDCPGPNLPRTLYTDLVNPQMSLYSYTLRCHFGPSNKLMCPRIPVHNFYAKRGQWSVTQLYLA